MPPPCRRHTAAFLRPAPALDRICRFASSLITTAEARSARAEECAAEPSRLEEGAAGSRRELFASYIRYERTDTKRTVDLRVGGDSDRVRSGRVCTDAVANQQIVSEMCRTDASAGKLKPDGVHGKNAAVILNRNIVGRSAVGCSSAP